MKVQSAFSNLRVATKLSLGFGLVLLLLVMIAGSTVRTLSSLETDLASFSRQASNSLSATGIELSHAEVQAAVRSLSTLDTPEARAALKRSYAHLKDVVREQSVASTIPARKEAWARIHAELTERYDPMVSGPESIEARQDEVAAARRVLTPVGTALAATLTDLIAAYGSSEAGTPLILLQDRFLRARISMRGFQYTGASAEFEEARRLLGEGAQQAARLAEARSTGADPRVAELRRGLAAYLEATLGMNAAIAARERTRALQAERDADLVARIGTLRQGTVELMRETEARATGEAGLARSVTLAAAALALLVGIAFAVLIARSVARPVAAMTAAMGRLAEGDTGAPVPFTARRDEIGAMAGAVAVFRDSAIRARALEEETALARAGAEAQRKAALRTMADAFERAVGGVVDEVGTAAGALQRTAAGMAGLASQTAAQSATVAAAAEEASVNVGTVSAAAEELGASVREIGRQVDGSAALARLAVDEAGRSAGLVRDLTEAAARIGNVVAMITGIAEQTNLLALNATIEAARAGEAGRGFAVVAAEVKALASQTARATGDITAQIEQVQASSTQAAAAIGGIGTRIGEISSLTTAIATAVDQQAAATQEIVRNVAEAAAGTGHVTGNIAGVAGAAEETGAAATAVLASTADLSRQSNLLSREVAQFLAEVRAA
ncbi:methyl-accepting chemotaxis protein [Methylobacterium sp. A54F]